MDVLLCRSRLYDDTANVSRKTNDHGMCVGATETTNNHQSLLPYNRQPHSKDNSQQDVFVFFYVFIHHLATDFT